MIGLAGLSLARRFGGLGVDAYILKGSLDVAQLEKDLLRLIGPP